MEDFLQELTDGADRVLSAAFSTPVKGTRSVGTGAAAVAAEAASAEFIPVPAGQTCLKIKVRPSASAAANNRSAGVSFYAEFFTEKQAFHRTLDAAAFTALVGRCAGSLFKNTVIQLTERGGTGRIETVSVLANKKGTVRVIRSAARAPALQQPPVSGGDRQKRYLLPEGTPVPFLVFLGVMTADGKVVQAKRDKFRQINRFLEFIDDVLPAVLDGRESVSTEQPLRIADFGCGKSYLTFAVHYYLTEIKRLPAAITGLDLKDDVVADCAALASRLHCSGLTFRRGDIAAYGSDRTGTPPDIVITLHACDTATDYALAYAVDHRARAVLSVPCCQHEVNAQLRAGDVPPQFAPLVKYGLIKERFAALVTDAVRAELLERAGYAVQILEFVDGSATPKNLLIRAIRKKTAESPVCASSPAALGSEVQAAGGVEVQAAGSGAAALTEALRVRTTMQTLLERE